MQNCKIIDLGLISSATIEFFLEIGLKTIYPSRYQQKNILEYLSIFELIKFFLRWMKLEKNKLRKIFISERTALLNQYACPQDSINFEDLFKYEFDKDHFPNGKLNELDSMTKKEDFTKMIGLISNLKFNEGYLELFQRTKKTVKQITTMPIPNEILHKNKNEETENIKIWLGELIYIFRPLIYCFSMLFFRYSSYKPYLLSFFLDLMRLFLQKNIYFYWKMEKKEFIKRNYDLIFNYCFRNPIYSKILKPKIFNPILNSVFRRVGIFKKIFYFVLELRVALSFLM